MPSKGTVFYVEPDIRVETNRPDNGRIILVIRQGDGLPTIDVDMSEALAGGIADSIHAIIGGTSITADAI